MAYILFHLLKNSLLPTCRVASAAGVRPDGPVVVGGLVGVAASAEQADVQAGVQTQ